MSQDLKLSREQGLRHEYLCLLLDRPNPPTMQDAMLLADAAADFVATGEIKGLSPAQPERSLTRFSRRREPAVKPH